MSRHARLRVLLADLSSPAAGRDVDPRLSRAARSLRDAGHEVVLLGAVRSVEVLDSIAVQEDVDATCVWDGDSLGVTGPDDAVTSAIESLLGR